MKEKIDKTVGFALCGSFCTFREALDALKAVTEQFATVIPILSEISAVTDTRFGTAQAHTDEITALCGRRPLTSIREVEPIGPKGLLDLLIVAPCTGNTLGKLAQGITDSTVTMAAKAQLRNQRPVLLAVSTNDGLAASGRNIMDLMQRKHIYMVPFGQDDPAKKPTSLKADMSLIPEAALAALEERQMQPVLL
jgi:dipicolinate synthase subunit B